MLNEHLGKLIQDSSSFYRRDSLRFEENKKLTSERNKLILYVRNKKYADDPTTKMTTQKEDAMMALSLHKIDL